MPDQPDQPDPQFLPPGLELGDDDVVTEITEVTELPDGTELVESIGAAEAGEPVDLDPEPAEPERTSGFDGVGTRREARERALALLYEAEQKDLVPPAAVIAALAVPPEPYAEVLVVGVSDHLDELDELIGRFSVGWTVQRMPAIDRTLLRLGCYELAYTDVPVGACISEAVELAKRYSTDDSHTFVNGLLSRLATELRSEA